MSAWIRGVEGCHGERRPIRYANSGWIAVCVGLANGRDGPPQLVVVLGFVESNCAVGEGEIKGSEQASGGRQIGVVGDGSVLGNLIPRVPNWPGPEFCDHSLLRRSRRAGILPQVFHLVDGLRVSLAGQSRGRLWAKLSCIVEHKGSDVLPARKDRRCKLRRCGHVVTRLVT